MKILVAQLCLTLCDPMDPPGFSTKGFSRQEYWSGLPCPSPGDLPSLGTECGSPTLQADSLPSEPPGKPNVKLYKPLLKNNLTLSILAADSDHLLLSALFYRNVIYVIYGKLFSQWYLWMLLIISENWKQTKCWNLREW